ncbi:ABC transporter ATP-binding protein [Nanoarchaeota archaeon]
MELKTITKKIFLLIFENQYEITSTFLRFQEHYESPEFRGKIFTLEEYKEWYSTIKGSFTYYTDWHGFNIPSHILKPFYEGKFDPLSEKEKKLLGLFKDKKGKFYIIGIHKGVPVSSLLNHEIAHGLFYTDEKYKDSVLEILSKYDIGDIKEKLRKSGGYHEDVLDDEVHAYSLDNPFSELHKEIKENFEKALSRNKISVK